MAKMINKKTELYAGQKFDIIDTNGNEYRLVIEQDEFSEDPRSWDNLGTMLCCHPNYRLGDCNSNRETEEELIKLCHKYGKTDEGIDDMSFGGIVRFILGQNDICGLPLWLYDHSGISISAGKVDDWDSSFVGLIFVDKETFFAQTCRKDDCDWKKEAEKILRGEIKTYDDFLEGNVYQWVLYEPVVVIEQTLDGKELSRKIDKEGTLVDSMSGFYNPTLEDIKDYFDFEIAEIELVD